MSFLYLGCLVAAAAMSNRTLSGRGGNPADTLAAAAERTAVAAAVADSGSDELSFWPTRDRRTCGVPADLGESTHMDASGGLHYAQ